MSAQPHRRLSARRGSTTALDPYALHADINENPNRTSSSKLTIVRVLQPQSTPNSPVTLNDPPTSFTSTSRRRRLGSSGPHSPPTTDSSPPGRLSFAFSSFGPSDGHGHSSDRSGTAPSPTSSPRMRPSSPRLAPAGGPAFSLGKPRLTPDQLVDLARQATNPRTLAQIAITPGPSSPAPLSAQSGGGISMGGSPGSRSTHLPNVSTNVMPATFTPLPDDILLPFIHRPSEVAQVISTPPDAKLFALLSQALPTDPGETDSTSDSSTSVAHPPRDPSLWTYPQLIHHLTQVDRDVASDPIWAFAARKCILSHSELIWERVKGALGIPPELDVDYDFTRKLHRSTSQEKRDARMRKLRMELREGAPKPRLGQGNIHDESAIEDDDDESTDNEISEDEGRGATGHWPDWDATMDTPVHVRHEGRLASAPSISRRDSAHDVGGVVIGSFNDSSSIGISTEGPSPPLGAMRMDSEDSDFISIEALLAPSPEFTGTLGSNPPPPLSHAASALVGAGVASDTPAAEGVGLGDIAEGEEDEDEENANDADSSQNPGDNKAESKPEEDDLISPSQIQGLRIMTSPVHAAGSYGVGGLFVPHHNHHLLSTGHGSGDSTPHNVLSPVPISPAVGDDNKDESRSLARGSAELPASALGHPITPPTSGRNHSRTSSFSSVTGVSIGPFSRSESTGTLASLMAVAQNQQQQPFSGSDAGDSAGYGSDWSVGATAGSTGGGAGPHQPEIVGDRLPGQPLFVSNFARLNGSPTLKLIGGSSGRPSPPSRFKVKRTGSTGGGVVGSVPSSSFLGSPGTGKAGGEGSDAETSPNVKRRAWSHGVLH